MSSRRIERDKSLAVLYSEIAAQWHPTKNGELSPGDIGSGSAAKVWWLCSKGHEWQSQVCHRAKEHTRCPYCSGRLPIKGKNDFETMYPELAAEWCCEKNDGLMPYDILPHGSRKIWWRCKKGHSWQAPVISRTNLKAGCPICAGQRTLPGENDLATLRPDLEAEWHPSKNRDFKPSDCTISSGRKVWWRCKEGHEWQSVVSTRTGKDNCGCPYCYGRYAVPGVNDLETVKPELALEWHPTKNKMKPSQILPNSNKKAWWLCPECGYEWRTLIPSRSARGSGCPRCAGRVR